MTLGGSRRIGQDRTGQGQGAAAGQRMAAKGAQHGLQIKEKCCLERFMENWERREGRKERKDFPSGHEKKKGRMALDWTGSAQLIYRVA